MEQSGRLAGALEVLHGLLGALAGVLDIREVFDRVAAVAQQVLPHDAVIVIVPAGESGAATNYAIRGFGDASVTAAARVREPELLTEPWDFRIIDDLASHPAYSDSPAVSAGMHGALLLPVRLDGRLEAFLAFMSREAGRFTRDEVLIGQRIADHIALALSHQRLAEEARRAAALQERAANLEMLDGLLHTLTGVLDIREVFGRVSEIARQVLPHDAMAFPIVTEVVDGEINVVPFATVGMPAGIVPSKRTVPAVLRYLYYEPWEYEIFDRVLSDGDPRSVPFADWGYQSILRVPVRLEGRLAGILVFFGRAEAAFSKGDVLVARRIADHVALALSHQRLAEEARRHDELRARTEKLDLLDAALASVTGGSELPDVFHRVSSVTQKALAHDALVLTSVLPDGLRAKVYASTTTESVPWPDTVDVPPLMRSNPDWEFDLIDDLQARADHRNLEATTRGFRGALRMPIRLDGEYVAGVSFLSFTPSQYTPADIPIARRIADRLALSFLKERRNEASQRADEATERAARLESRVRALTEELDARTGYRRVVGDSPEWKRVLTQATQVAATDTTVLLLGESGTGKEVVARFVHRASPRTGGPFIAINCAALPEQLLEAEVFGYERGAFTGATQSKPGQLEQAAGGTLFLDEVAEMSPSAQAKFLRVLQEREFQRLGGTRVLKTDARIVAATNRNLQDAMVRGSFREDLFYRLNVFAISLPALRERRSDILALSDAFLAEYGRSLTRAPAGISRDARKLLMEYEWPGNVRELRNILERAAILCDGGLITADHLSIRPAIAAKPAAPHVAAPRAAAVSAPPPAAAAGGPERGPAGGIHDVERAMIEQALQNARFNKSQAAKELGITRAQLYVRMRRYGLE